MQEELMQEEVATATRRHWIKDRGASMVEYALLLALLAMIAIGAISTFGETLNQEYEDIGSDITSASN